MHPLTQERDCIVKVNLVNCHAEDEVQSLVLVPRDNMPIEVEEDQRCHVSRALFAIDEGMVQDQRVKQRRSPGRNI
jgi:hypothetical protein